MGNEEGDYDDEYDSEEEEYDSQEDFADFELEDAKASKKKFTRRDYDDSDAGSGESLKKPKQSKRRKDEEDHRQLDLLETLAAQMKEERDCVACPCLRPIFV